MASASMLPLSNYFFLVQFAVLQNPDNMPKTSHILVLHVVIAAELSDVRLACLLETIAEVVVAHGHLKYIYYHTNKSSTI